MVASGLQNGGPDQKLKINYKSLFRMHNRVFALDVVFDAIWVPLGVDLGLQNGTFSDIFRLQVALVSRRWFRIASVIDFGPFAVLKIAFPSRR